ncbi:hypothetical protein CR513_24135, partial [Mucuna pruriens]
MLLSNGYASNLTTCIDINGAKLHGVKSRDHHVFMHRLLPIAFNFLPNAIWKPLVELKLTYTLHVDQLMDMERIILVLLCKLEQIFPPNFFDSMEHLPIYLVFFYTIDILRFLRSLKEKVKNKARIKGSIYQAY